MSDQPGEELDEAIGDDYPPERPLGVEDYGTTAAEERWDEPLDERMAREEPDVIVAEDDGLELVAPDEGSRPDDEKDEVATAVADDVGPLSEEDAFTGDESRRDYATEREAPAPAEEDAVHVRPEP